MKTNLKNIIIGGLCLMGMTSCSLDEYNPSGSNAETIYSTEEGFGYLVNSAYYNFRAQFYGREDIMFLGEGGGDLWYMGQKGTYARQLMAYDDLSSTTGQIKNTWQRLYEIVNYCNAGLDRIDKVTFKDPQTKLTKEGELRFLRAYTYWLICEFYGNAVLREHETVGVQLTAQRSPISDFYKLIIGDLERATEILPVTQSDYGRADKKAAYGLLARTTLTYASHLEYFENNKSAADPVYQQAYDAAEYLIANQSALGCKLYDAFEEVFMPENNRNNAEALWSITHSTNSALNPQPNNPNRLFMWYNSKYTALCGMPSDEVLEYGMDNNRRMMPTKYLLNLFNEEIDSRYYSSFREVHILPEESGTYTWTENDIVVFNKSFDVSDNIQIQPGDTALFYTKKVIPDKASVKYGVKDINDLYNPNGSISDIATNNPYYPSLRKFRNPDRAKKSQAGNKNVLVMRLAETYLIAAEAAYKLGDSDKATARVNDIRKRAAVKEPVNRTQEMMIGAHEINIDFLLDERARELCGEHLRWFDLKRTKQIENRVGPGKANPDITMFDPARHYLRPIPQAELDALENSEEFGQNPGY